MRDPNHDLVQALHHVMDQTWRIEKHYLPNAEGEEHCTKIWEQMLDEGKKHELMLRDEIARHVKENRFD